MACHRGRTKRVPSSSLNLPSPSEIFAPLLRSAGRSDSPSSCKRLFQQIKHHVKHNIFLSNLVLQMYGNCGAPDEARVFFDSMRNRDIYTWNFMLKSYVKSGHPTSALQLFEQMCQEGMMPNKFLYVTMISMFSSNICTSIGKLMHARISDGEYSSDVSLQTALVSMYAKRGSLESARWMFDRINGKDAASWNSIIAGYAQHEYRKEAMKLFGEMQHQGLLSNAATVITILSSCVHPAAIADGRWLHSQIKGTELLADISVCNALIAMYGKCGSLQDACMVLHSMRERDKVTYLNVFSACASEASLKEAKRLHECLQKEDLEMDVVMENSLINMYGKCGGSQEARTVFDKMVERNLISWNSLLSVYAQNRQGSSAMYLLRQMLQEGVMPNKITFISSVDACANLGNAFLGKQVHASIRTSGLEQDIVLDTALIHMYGKCNNVSAAQNIFDMMTEQDAACWNAIISVYAQHDEGDFALSLFLQMQQEGVLPDKISFVSALSSCNNETTFWAGKQLHACIALTWLNSDLIVGNALINMYGKCSSLEDAKTFFKNMAKRDTISYVNMFSLCANRAALHEGQGLHTSIMGTEMEADVIVGNALINMYGKCGCLGHADSFFERMSAKNLVSWNGMLSVYAQNGLGEITLQLFDKMRCQGIMPNAVTLVCVLSACSHAGLLDEGFGYLSLMMQKHGLALNTDHYNCVIDMLARAGMLDEAEKLIQTMPFKPSVVAWTTLLGACRNQTDSERAVRVAERLFKLDPAKSSIFVILANICTTILYVNDVSDEQEATGIITEMRCLNFNDHQRLIHR